MACTHEIEKSFRSRIPSTPIPPEADSWRQSSEKWPFDSMKPLVYRMKPDGLAPRRRLPGALVDRLVEALGLNLSIDIPRIDLLPLVNLTLASHEKPSWRSTATSSRMGALENWLRNKLRGFVLVLLISELAENPDSLCRLAASASDCAPRAFFFIAIEPVVPRLGH